MVSGSPERTQLGDALVALGLATGDEVRRAEEASRRASGRRSLREVLRETTSLTDEQIARAYSSAYNIPLLSEDQMPDELPVDRVSFDFLKTNMLLPVSFDGVVMDVAVADPPGDGAVESLRASFDCDVRLFVAPASLIIEQIDRMSASKEAVMQRLLEGVADETAADQMSELSHLRDMAQEKGIIQLANLIIDNAIKEHASDIHIEPEELEVRVRYRIDGILYKRESLPLKTQAALTSRMKLLAGMNIAERRLPQDGRIRGRFGGQDVDIRVSSIPTVHGESIVMRLLYQDNKLITLEGLGFSDDILTVYKEIIKRPYGMILMTGPTGSGKSTTLYASLDVIKAPALKIITVEEPVEYMIPGISQIAVKPKIGLTFANGLRHIVRQDPDVIMVGEIRDIETASIAIHAALTGHLLFSTLHTNDSPTAITRLVEMGVENFLVASTLLAVAAQRLVRRLCPACSEVTEAPSDMLEELDGAVRTVRRAVGCPECMGTGYKGRIAIIELLVITDEIRDMITGRATARQIKERAVAGGMRTLRADGMNKAARGLTTLDEVYRVTQAEL